MKKYFLLLAAMFMSVSSLFGADNNKMIEIPLWPDGAPSSNGLESVEETGDNVRASKVSNPILYVFPARKPNGKMVIACPGGGYAHLAMAHEGFDMADWMNRQGITFAVLKYRMPNGHSEVPLDDARRAISIAREKASEWGVNPSKIGIMGSSAGGHLAASLSTLYGEDSARPDFQILLYPVISMGDITHKGSRDNLLGKEASAEAVEHFTLANRVDSNSPRAFIALSADDKAVPPMNGIGYAEALIANNVPVTLHVYPSGGHGWGYRDSFKYKREWTAELEKFLSEL